VQDVLYEALHFASVAGDKDPGWQFVSEAANRFALGLVNGAFSQFSEQVDFGDKPHAGDQRVAVDTSTDVVAGTIAGMAAGRAANVAAGTAVGMATGRAANVTADTAVGMATGRATDPAAVGILLLVLHTGDPIPAMDMDNAAVENKRDVERVEVALFVAAQASALGLLLDDGDDLLAECGEAAGHDEPHVAGAEHHDAPTQVPAVDVDHLLGGACGEYPGRPGTGDGKRADGPLAAAGCDDDGFCLNAAHAARPCQGEHPVGLDADGRGIEPELDTCLEQFGDQRGDVFRAVELFVVLAHAKTCVQALRQEATQVGVPLDQKYILRCDPLFLCCQSGGDASASTADDDERDTYGSVREEQGSNVGETGVTMPVRGT